MPNKTNSVTRMTFHMGHKLGMQSRLPRSGVLSGRNKALTHKSQKTTYDRSYQDLGPGTTRNESAQAAPRTQLYGPAVASRMLTNGGGWSCASVSGPCMERLCSWPSWLSAAPRL